MGSFIDEVLGSRWRVGRKLERTLYAQWGREPSDDDGLLGLIDDPEVAAWIRDEHNARIDGEVVPKVKCGGCEGLGAHSPRCSTQPGWRWQRLMDAAEQLGDDIGPNDMESANMAYAIAARMKTLRDEERDQDQLGHNLGT